MVIPSSLTPNNQTRSSARTGYYDPVVLRPNLHVATGQTVKRLMFGNNTVFGKRSSKVPVIGVEVSLSLQGWKLRIDEVCVVARGRAIGTNEESSSHERSDIGSWSRPLAASPADFRRWSSGCTQGSQNPSEDRPPRCWEQFPGSPDGVSGLQLSVNPPGRPKCCSTDH
jgi:hypothetical protein